MSVDLTKLTAHLSPEQQELVKKLYHRKEENSTAAFLWCFFFGTLGAHRFYLHQWGKGFARLIVPLLAAVVIVGGIFANIQQYAFISIAIVLLGIALVWEVVDLFRIDHEVYERNLHLAEELIAGALLSDHSTEQQALGRMQVMMEETAAAPAAAIEHEHAVQEAAGIEPPVDVETPVAEASEAEYLSSTRTVISEEPEAQRKENDFDPSHSWSVSERKGNEAEVAEETDAAGLAAATAAALVTEHETTRAHVETDHGVTDSLELHNTVVETGEARVGELPVEETPAMEGAGVAPDQEGVAAAEETMTSGYDTVAVQSGAPGEAETTVFGSASATATNAMVEEREAVPQVIVPTHDMTDMGHTEEEFPIADIGTDTSPLLIAIPRDFASMGSVAESTDESMAVVEEAEVAPLSPATGNAEPPMVSTWTPQEELPADTYVPPAVPVATVPAEEPPAAAEAAPPSDAVAPAQEETPAWMLPTVIAGARAAEQAEQAQPDAKPESPVMPEEDVLPASSPEATLASVPDDHHVMTFDETQGTGEIPAIPGEGTVPEAKHQTLRRVRVVRQVKVNGQVVEETAAEEYIDPDTDPEPVRARLRDKLHAEAQARQVQEGSSQE